jgi:hypothetical protein
MSEALAVPLSPEAERDLRATLPTSVPELGEIIGIYTPGKVAPWLYYVVATVYLIIAGGLWGFAESLAAEAPERPVLFIVAAVVGLVGLACGIMGVVQESFPKLLPLSKYVLCGYGLVYSRGDETHTAAWSELEIRKTRANPFNPRYKISGHGSDPFVVKSTMFRRKLLRALLEAQVHYACPKMIEAIRAGETIQFGQVGVSAAGLAQGDEVIRWGRIEALNFSYDQRKTQQLFLSVEARGHDTLRLNASQDLPNIWLFMELVSQLHPPLETYKTSQAWWLK